MIGNLHLTAAGARASMKRNREAYDLTHAPFSQQTNIQRYMSAGTEYGDGRRAKAYLKRLHAAKYLKCDALLKELFFSTLTQCRRFGFCSTSGIFPREEAGGDTDNVGGAAMWLSNGSRYPVTNAKAAGLFRGIAMFTIRSTRISDSSENKLNEVQQAMGFTTITGQAAAQTISSCYRRFNSRPKLASQSANCGAIDGNLSPTVTIQQFGGSVNTPLDMNTLYCSEVGDINSVESKAVQSTNFMHAVGTSIASMGTTTLGQAAGNVQTPPVNWTGAGSVVNTNNRYYANLKNTTVRISDGYLEMDITNGKATSTFIELVIHSFKKNDPKVGVQDLVDAIHNSVQYQQTDRNTSPYYNNVDSLQQPGGWQAFWDPTYPFLGCKSQHRTSINNIAGEVHRSCHMLGPGQSKLVKIALGSLYYDIGSKCKSGGGDGDTNTPFSFDNPGMGVGSLLISVGHSGVMGLSAPVDPINAGTTDTHPVDQFSVYPDSYDPSSLEHAIAGGGFWVGKSFCPSEIVVNGRYCEKFYPSYVVDKERRNWSDRPLIPPSVNSRALPTALPVTNTVGTVAAAERGITAAVTSQNNAAATGT